MKRRQWLATVPGLIWPWRAMSQGAKPVTSADHAWQFPRDFGAHPEHRTEWWYVTGQFQSGQGAQRRPWGFQITFFRSRIDTAQGSDSAFAAKQIILAHVAITDLQGGRLHHDQRVARAGLTLADASTADTHAYIRDWQLQRSGPVEQSRYSARIAARSFGLDLQMTQTQPLILQGQGGFSRKGEQPGLASHYYSHPHLALKGTLRWQGQDTAVQGQAWMDHEWSEFLVAPDVLGWDWIGMNLQGGGALMAFRMRRQDGSSAWAGGSYRLPGQPLRVFKPDEVVFKPLRHWKSPSTGAQYPVAWSIQTPVGLFKVKALLDAQELNGQHSTGNIYWEGLSQLLNAQDQPVGQGYLEMTGYAGKLVL